MGKAKIVAGDGPFVFGQSYTTEEVVASWQASGPAENGHWAKIECSQNGHLVYAQYADLTPPLVQSGFTFGPTPSWSGGAASCVLKLYAMNDGAFSRVKATSAEFPAG